MFTNVSEFPAAVISEIAHSAEKTCPYFCKNTKAPSLKKHSLYKHKSKSLISQTTVHSKLRDLTVFFKLKVREKERVSVLLDRFDPNASKLLQLPRRQKTNNEGETEILYGV